MPLQSNIQVKIQQLLAQSSRTELQAAASALTTRYRDRDAAGEAGFRSRAECLAYIAMRMPATYEASRKVFREIADQLPELAIHSILDVGSGPATSVIAACDTFQDIREAVLIEPSGTMAAFGAQLLAEAIDDRATNVVWQGVNVHETELYARSDLVAASYVLGELSGDMLRFVDRLWAATDELLVLIEPGSSAGFGRLRLVRQHIIEQGGQILAPCTHHSACPMAANDWCHFSVSVQRTKEHKRLKSGSRGDESEKFAYLVASKRPITRASLSRVVKRPIKGKGHVYLDLCSDTGLARHVVSKRDPSHYRIARKSAWGDLWSSET